MKKNDVISIYQAPLTEEDYEGEAVLIKKVAANGFFNGRELETWEVLFIGDEAPVMRRILRPEKRPEVAK